VEPDTGSVKLGANLETAYIDQARAELKPDMMLRDVLTPLGGDQVMVRGSPRHVISYAKDFLFTDAQIRQPVKSLSGGERNRLLLARALATPANLLILDEPTNDLDMDTLDLLEDVLADYEGTLILVSHDRDFVDRLATSTIALNGRGDVVETPGGWQDFLQQNPGYFRAAPVSRGDQAPAKAIAARPEAAKAVKLSYKDARRLQELDSILSKIPVEIAKMETELADPGLYGRDFPKFDRLMKAMDKARGELSAAENEWLALEERREALESGR
jgi:ATP-binding cassette subfamily F protein uup